MKYLLLLVFLTYATCCLSQSYDFIPDNHLIQARNNFLNNYWKNPDSALVYAREVSKDPAHILFLREMLHTDAFFYFHEKTREQILLRAEKSETNEFSWEQLENSYEDDMLSPIYETLNKLESDTNLLLSSATRAILYWVNIQKNEANVEVVKRMINDFIAKELSQDDLYYNGAGLYALLIYQQISKNNDLKEIANNLLLTTINKLKEVQITGNVNSLPRSILYKRAWYRYLCATANHMLGTELLNQGENTKATIYLNDAFDYSPDITDQRFRDVYSSPKYYLNNDNDEKLYQSYLEYLKTVENINQTLLESYTVQALKDPVVYKDILQTYYVENSSAGIPFQKFWENTINSTLSSAPDDDFIMADGKLFSSIRKDKWNLLVFWGTWCGPCRKKHPDLQNFYEEILLKYQDKITVVTVSCHDTQEKVDNYMYKNKYSFPVVLSNGYIEKSYNIHGYPTMFLITPNGKYLNVPDQNDDWIQFVKKYASLE